MGKQMGRPIIGEPKNIILKIRIDKTTNEKLEKYCKQSGKSRTDAIREALKAFLKYNV